MKKLIFSDNYINDPPKNEDWLFTPNVCVSAENANSNQLFNSKDLMSYIVNSIQDGVSVLDTDFNVKYANTSMEYWYVGAKELMNEKCYKVFHNRTNPCDNCPIIKSIDSKRPSKEIVKFVSSGVEKGWQELYAVPIINPDNNVIGVIEYIRDITFRYRIENELQNVVRRFDDLEKKNEAFSELFKQRDNDVIKLEETILDNMQKFIKPSLEYLKKNLNDKDVKSIEAMLDQIIYPITKKRPSKMNDLTPRQLQIAGMIKEGKSSKEISDILCITIKAVSYHRANIRKKLGLNKSSENSNLNTYLLMYF